MPTLPLLSILILSANVVELTVEKVKAEERDTTVGSVHNAAIEPILYFALSAASAWNKI